MFYKITFWICFISASLLCTLWMLTSCGTSFLEVLLAAFGTGFVVAFLINFLVKMTIRTIRWIFRFGAYRNSISGND